MQGEGVVCILGLHMFACVSTRVTIYLSTALTLLLSPPGHVDGTGTITNKQPENESLWITVNCSPDLIKYIVPKGRSHLRYCVLD